MLKQPLDPKLFADGARLPAIKSWLLDTVWARSRYQSSEEDRYLREGEEAVCALEELIATGAPEVWGELTAESQSAPTPKSSLMEVLVPWVELEPR